VDNRTVVTGDRILVKDQTTQTQNGIYVVSSPGTGSNGTWVRAADADESGDLSGSTSVFVSEGDTNDNTGWVISTDAAITLGSTNITWVQVSASGTYTAINANSGGVGVYDGKSGNQFNFRGIAAFSSKISATLNSTNKTIELDVNEANLTHDNIGGTLSVGKGGTSATTAAGARTNLGLGTQATKSAYVSDLGAGPTIVVTHGLGTKDVLIQIYENATGDEVGVEVERTSTTTVTVKFEEAQTANAYRILILPLA
jgi:hypothetical protein